MCGSTVTSIDPTSTQNRAMSDDLYADTSDSSSDENASATAERVDGISAKMTMSIADLLPNRKKLLKILAAGLLLVLGVIIYIFMTHDDVPDPCKILHKDSVENQVQLFKCQNRSTELTGNAVSAPHESNHTSNHTG